MDVLILKALVFGVCTEAPDISKLPSNPFRRSVDYGSHGTWSDPALDEAQRPPRTASPYSSS